MGSPTPPSDFWGMLVFLLPVIVGGLIGVLGGLAGAGYGSRLSEHRDYKSKRREKLEALVTAAYELDVWFKREENAYFWDGPDNFEPSPLSSIQTIALLYFPELQPESDALSLAAKSYRMWLIEGRQKKLQNNPQLVPQDHLAALATVYQPFLNNRGTLLKRANATMVGLDAS
jgi:hypothetical protein